MLAGTLAQLGRYDEALAACEQALQLDDKAEYWYLKVSILKVAKRASEAITTLDEIITRRPNDCAPVYEKAFLLYESKRYDDAVSTLDEGLSRFPNNVQLLMLKGSAFSSLERNDNALAAWNQVFVLQPDDAAALRNVLSIYAQKKRYGDMLLPTNRLLARNKLDAEVWAARINALYELSQYDAARAAGVEALRLAPDDASVKTWAEFADRAIHMPGRNGHIILRDGRRMEYAEYGAPDGYPILCCHGTPGCRFDFSHDDDVAKELSLRLIVPDRPGYGLSDPMRRQSYLRWTDDAAELADALRITRFAVLGISGGGPYAAACAYKLPERITSLTLISAPARLPLWKLWPGLGWQTRISGVAQRILPRPLRRAADRLAARLARKNPDAMLRFQERVLNGAGKTDRPRVFTPRELETAAEPFRQSSLGETWDSRLLTRRWGFNVQDITVPTYVWHGEKDRQAPLVAGQFYARAIPNCRATFFPNEGHSIIHPHLREIFGAITKAAEVAVPDVAEAATEA